MYLKNLRSDVELQRLFVFYINIFPEKVRDGRSCFTLDQREKMKAHFSATEGVINSSEVLKYARNNFSVSCSF